jgi:hypothetical protein
MAKVRGPLMSVAASGRMGLFLTFRQTARGSVCQLPPIPRSSPSVPQQIERQRFAAALRAWRGLDALTKARWETRGMIFRRQPVILFVSEYLMQRCEPPALPMLPSISRY